MTIQAYKFTESGMIPTSESAEDVWVKANDLVALGENKEGIIFEILQERSRQDEKWGEQNHPSVDDESAMLGNEICSYYRIPSEEAAKMACDYKFSIAPSGVGSWTDILIEELSEAVSAPNDIKRREELIQLAACVVAHIECIDRKSKNSVAVESKEN